jgi:hypothetical protein
LNWTALSLGCVLLLLSVPAMVCAGPPYITDDPEPVEYQHWEVYVASIFTKQPDAWTATAPHLEVNYGTVPNLQLHTILPMTLDAPGQGASTYGYGDTELGAKYRFIQEGNWRPEIGTFPLLEVPTGSHERNLGSGHLETFLPLWMQKSIGPWTAYGGGGYWINPGAHNRNWWFTGLVVQCEVLPGLTPGIEVFHGTSQVIGGPRELGLDFGLIWDLSELQHIIFSAGPALEGSNQLQGYFAYQLTFGP